MSLNQEEVQRFTLPFQPAGTPEHRHSPDAQRTILLIEDNPADVGLIREALEEHSVACELLVIKDGERAIEYVRSSLETGETPCPDLIILDLNLPRKPGREVLERIRSSLNCSGVPILVLTSSDNRRDKDDAERLGASLYIRKPSRLVEFLALGDVFRRFLEPKQP